MDEGAGTFIVVERSGKRRWFRRWVGIVVATALVLSTGLPTGQPPGEGTLAVSGAVSWFRSGPAWSWAGAATLGYPDVPVQQRGPSQRPGHYVTSPDRGRLGRDDEGLLPNGLPRVESGPPSTTPARQGHFDPKTSRRDPLKSNQSSTLYVNADGSVTRQFGAGPMNYRDAKGRWQPIDTTLVARGDRLSVNASDVVVSVAGPARPGTDRDRSAAVSEQPLGDWTELASVTLPGGQVVGFDLDGAARVLPDVSGSASTYRGILPFTDIELVANAVGLKETIVLHSAQAPTSWVFPLRLDGLSPRQEPDGSLVLLDDAGHVAARIPTGTMWDSAPVDASGAPPTSAGVTYRLDQVDGAPVIRVSVDRAWLDDPSRVYPVFVDPTTVTNTTGDVYVDNDSTTTNHNGNDLPVGTFNSGTVAARSFLHFDDFDSDGLANKRITSANLKLYHTWSYDCTHHEPFYVQKVREAWTVAALTTAGLPGPKTSNTIGSLTIANNNPACTNTSGNRSVGAWATVALNTGAFRGWSNGEPNDGLRLTASETSSYGWKRFTAANYGTTYMPRLELTWADNVAPQVNWQAPNYGESVPTLTPQLTINGHDPDVYPKSLRYRYWVYEQLPDQAQTQTQVADSGLIDTATWTVPSGLLKWGRTYRWAAQVHDGLTTSATMLDSARAAFTTPPPQLLITSNLSSNGDRGFAPGEANYTAHATDAQVESVGPALAIERHYNSGDPRVAGAFGSGWSSLLDARAKVRRDASGAEWTVVVTYPNGQEVSFGRESDGTYSPPMGRFASFASVAGGYRLIEKDRTTYLFTSAAGTDTYGLTSITDPMGRTLSVGWTSGKPTTLTSASGRSLTIGWTTPAGATAAHVSTVTNGLSHQWTYQYTNDRLWKACLPTGVTKCTVYGYSDLSLAPSVTNNLDPYSYWRLGESSGTQAKSEVKARMGVDAGTLNTVTLGQAGPLVGTTATAMGFNGTASRIDVPVSAVAQTSRQSIAMWFKQTAGDGVLYGQSYDPLTSATTNAPYTPILYTGTDGKLYGQFPTAPLVENQWSFTHSASGKCMAVSAAVDYEEAFLYDCTGGENKRFTLDSSERLTVTIGGTTKCVDAMGGQTGDGTDVVLYTCHNDDNQKWLIYPDGRVVNKKAKKCLDTFGGGITNSTRIVLWTCAKPGTKNQAFSSTQHTPMVSTGTVNDGQWHHVLLVADGTVQRMYVDGVEVASKTATVVSMGARYASLGVGFMGGRWPKPAVTSSTTNQGSRDYFNGSMAEVAQFDRALTAADAAALFAARNSSKVLASTTRPLGGTDASITYDTARGVVSQVTDGNGGQWQLNAPTVSGSSLIHSAAVLAGVPSDYWRMKETGVTEAVNDVNGSVGTFSNVGLGQAGAFSDATSAYFNGTTAEMVADAPSIDTAASFSISAWAKLETTSGHRVAITVLGSQAPGVFLGFNVTDNRWQATMFQSDTVGATPSKANSTAPPTPNQWTHLVATYDSATRVLKLYVNAAAQGSVTVGGTAWSAPGPIVVGRGQSNGASTFYYKGWLNDVATYRSVLSAQQVAEQYAARDQATGSVPAKHVTLTGPSAETISHVYDVETGRKVADVDGLGKTTLYSYGPTGFVRTLTDPNNHITVNDHDARGNVVMTKTCQDASTSDCSKSFFSYWPDATTKVLTPNPLNDVLLTERGPGSASESDNTYLTSYTYDAPTGLRTSITEPGGRVTTVAYTTASTPAAGGGFAPAGLPSVSTTPGQAVTTFSYFSNGDLASVTDPAGKVTTFTYDTVGRTLTETEATTAYPAGLTTTYTYDEFGRVLTETAPTVFNQVSGAYHTAKRTTAYNDDGNITSETVDDTTGGDAQRAVTFGYNALGQRTSQTDAAEKTTTYEYDSYGRVDRVIYADTNSVRTEYDVNGNVLETVLEDWTGDPNDPSPATDLTLESMTYDDGGRLAAVTDAMGWVTEYDYTDNGLLKTVTRRDPSTSESYVYESNDYHATGELATQVTNNGLTSASFTYDASGNQLTTTLDPTGLNRTTTYTYSPDDFVTSVTRSDPTGTLQRSEAIYDPLGRIMARTTYTGNGLTPVGRWKMDETSGLTAADATGNSPATLTATGVSWSTDHGGSASFSASQSRMVTAGPVVDSGRSFTVAAWLNPHVGSGLFKALGGTGTLQNSFDLRYNNGVFGFAIRNNDVLGAGSTSATAPSGSPIDTWAHVVGVYDEDADNLKLYLNGALVTTTATANAPFTGRGPMLIGAGIFDGWPPGNHWNGKIDDVQVYQKALTATEVGEVYAGTAPAASATVVRESYTLDVDGHVRAVTNPEGKTTTIINDEMGRTVRTESPEFNTVVGEGTPVSTLAYSWIGYNTFGEQTQAKDANGNVTRYFYDEVGRVITVQLPSYTPPGSSTPLVPEVTYEYDDTGQLTVMTDPEDGETSYVHDQLGRVAKITAPDGGISTYTYTETGEEASHTDPTGARVTSTYDYLGRTETSTEIVRQDSASYITTYDYGTGTWPASVTSPEDVETAFTYNKAGETLTVKDGVNNITTLGYDGLGRQNRVTLPDGTYSTVEFDGAGRQTRLRSYDASATLLRTLTNTYDRNGSVVASTDGRGTTTTFAYDAVGQLISQVEPISGSDSITSTFGYDAAGNPTRFVDGRGNAFITTYNAWSLPESQIEPATTAFPALADRRFTFAYDVAGRVAQASAPGGVTANFTYDEMGRLTLQTGSGAEATTANRTFDHDLAGRITSLSGSGGTNTLVYDDRGLLRSTTGPSGASTFTYNDDGLMASRVDAAGTTNYTYDAAGRLGTAANSGAGVSLTYGYNVNSQVNTITYGPGGNKRTLTYDPLQRLTDDELKTSSNSPIASIAYEWDGNDNITNRTTTGFSGSASNDYTYDLANRLIEWDNGTTPVVYAYDKSGNRLQAGTKTFTYDARNQLLSDSDGTAYEYTARGTLRKTINGSQTLNTLADAFGQVASQDVAGGSPTQYTYDGLGRAIKAGFAYSGLGNTLAADGTATYVRGPGDELLGVASGGTQRLAWTDLHRDVVGQFTSSSTSLPGSTTYEPYGKVASTAGMVGNLGYQSEWTDFGSGRVNMHTRWYNPDTGQFDTRDAANPPPTPASGHANKFAYAAGNPITKIDPTGERPTEETGGCLQVEVCQLAAEQSLLMDYQRALNQAYADSRMRLIDVLLQVGLGFLLDMIGYYDLVDCLKGSLTGCFNLITGAIPWGKVIKLGKAIYKAVERGISAYRRFKKIVSAANAAISRYTKLVNDVRKRVDDLRRKVAGLPKLPKKTPGKGKPGKSKPPKQDKPPTSKPAKNKPPKNKPKNPDKPKSKSKKGDGDNKKRNSRDDDDDRQENRRDDGDQPNKKDGCPTEGHSFAPDTKVLMADGSVRPISEVNVGDEVVATDPATGETAAEPVTMLHLNRDTELTDVTVSATPAGEAAPVGEGKGDHTVRGPTVLRTTANHPFWDATTGEWTDASELVPGESTLLGPDGQIQYVVGLHTYVGARDMRDLTVDRIHTYYVVAGHTPVLVHNCNVDYFDPDNDLLNAVHNQRIFDNNLRNNYAAARYLDESGIERIAVRRSSKGRGNHAEEKLLRDLGKGRILEIYSEFQPCRRTCSGKLKGLAVSWSWNWTTSAAGAAARGARDKAVRELLDLARQVT